MNKKVNCITKNTIIKVKLKPLNKYLDSQNKRKFS